MAKKSKKPIVEKISTTQTLDMTGFLNLDNLSGLIMELEDKGEVDMSNKLKKYNGRFGTLSFKISETAELDADENK